MIPGEWRAFLSIYRPHRRSLVVATLLLPGTAVVPGGSVWLLQRALAVAPSDEAPAQIGRFAFAFAALAAVGAAAGLARSVVTRRAAAAVASEARERLHCAFWNLGPGESLSGARMAALTHDADDLGYAVSAWVTAVRNPLTIGVLATTAVRLAPALAPWALVGVFLSAFAGRYTSRWLRRLSDRAQAARAAWMALAQEHLNGWETLRAAPAFDSEHQRFQRLNAQDRDARARLEVARSVPPSIAEVIGACAVAGLLYLGGIQVSKGALTLSAFVGFAVAVGLMSRPLAGLAEVWTLSQRSFAAWQRLRPWLTAPMPVLGPTRTSEPGVSASLAWEAVSVRYRTENGDAPSDRLAVDAVTLVARPGELLAIVGASGAGKSTLLRVAAGLVAPSSGRVTWTGPAGHPPLAFVPQEPFLLARSIRENLCVGVEGVSAQELDEAIAAAGLRAFIDGLPGGLETPIHELGRTVSGGERQRLCLARAMIQRPAMLLLDEATNQLDARTEAEIWERVRQWSVGRVVVAVAHHLGVAARADRIAVIDRGRLVECGSHADLVAANGVYAGLLRAAESR